LNPDINMWDTAAPYVRSWIRDELGPEAALADRLKTDTETLLRLPGLIRRLEEKYPPKGGAPEAPPLPPIPLITDKREGRGWMGYVLSGLAGAGAVWGAMALGWIG
jgi:ubiquinone biosynthesis protein